MQKDKDITYGNHAMSVRGQKIKSMGTLQGTKKLIAGRFRNRLETKLIVRVS